MTPFFVVEGDAINKSKASKENSLTQMSSFVTPSIFSSQGSEQYKPITAAQDPPTSW